MATVTLNISYGAVGGFPANESVASIQASITDTSVSPPVASTQSVTPDTASAVFANVDPGSYTFSVQGIDQNGAPLGNAVTGTFDVTATTIELQLPVSAGADVAA